ncbi:hypothetical protein B0H17DRAFT_1326284 [Mycena rosella]|uniref:Uncharacterized protein n=1 Tax=Mycena rosella TaxID=1033263 RepID=A0AAD7GUL4_MYCRO|nr:hypothetical protein B0H17DRAFT_1326284 [Mycena rosella]
MADRLATSALPGVPAPFTLALIAAPPPGKNSPRRLSVSPGSIYCTLSSAGAPGTAACPSSPPARAYNLRINGGNFYDVAGDMNVESAPPLNPDWDSEPLMALQFGTTPVLCSSYERVPVRLTGYIWGYAQHARP